ncbi:HAD-IIB family hydrolase [Lachnotalea sp. AF33-28]|uniref:HAD-IIB family hydrolase n=1 Tax=Lachnotalea sp. AF33-28 TaxID=2292046 RepID=UPI000E4ED1A6|nr:HAD-IIB family hydrolase [Lachnotalea sp. AF33-28]RHP36482.1 HAD-IIB family hydrolase [Lachnotalea sp. AF33-28]
MSIRLIAVDLDGVLNKSKKITQRTFNAVSEAVRKGIIVVPVSGRSLYGLPGEVKDYPGIRYIISSNGAKVYDIRDGRILFQDLIPYKEAAVLIQELNALPVKICIQESGNSYNQSHLLSFQRRFLYSKDYSRKKAIPCIDRYVKHRQLDLEKIQVFYTNKKTESAVLDLISSHPGLNAVPSADRYVEISRATATKGVALSCLCSWLGIMPEEVMAVGDNETDRSMLQFAGHAVAMSNALPDIKELAIEVAPCCLEEGVAAAIEKVLPEYDAGEA